MCDFKLKAGIKLLRTPSRQILIFFPRGTCQNFFRLESVFQQKPIPTFNCAHNKFNFLFQDKILSGAACDHCLFLWQHSSLQTSLFPTISSWEGQNQVHCAPFLYLNNHHSVSAGCLVPARTGIWLSPALSALPYGTFWSIGLSLRTASVPCTAPWVYHGQGQATSHCVAEFMFQQSRWLLK